MDFRDFAHDFQKISHILSLSHASNGRSVLISRGKDIWANVSAYSTLNEWNPAHRIVQTSLFDVIGQGDGGKLGVFLTTSLFLALAKLPDGGHPLITSEIREAIDTTRAHIRAHTREPTRADLLSLCSSLGEELSEIVVDAVLQAGVDTHISLEKYDGVGAEIIESESLIAEVPTPSFQSDVSLKGPLVAFLTERVYSFEQVRAPLELMGSFPNRPLLIIAPMIGGDALGTLKINRDNQVVEAHAIEAPLVSWGRGWMEDIAAFTGGTLFEPHLHSEFSIDLFGSAKEITLQKGRVIFEPYDDHAESTSKRIDLLLREAEEIPHPHTQDTWRKRAAALGGSLVRLKVGGTTEADARVRRNKTEKVIVSLSDMIRNGCVDGSIPTLANSPITGVPQLDHALRAPLRVVARNHNYGIPQSALSLPPIQEPFPTGRLLSLIDRSISVATTLASVGGVVFSKRK